jgi:hypothetical protein
VDAVEHADEGGQAVVVDRRGPGNAAAGRAGPQARALALVGAPAAVDGDVDDLVAGGDPLGLISSSAGSPGRSEPNRTAALSSYSSPSTAAPPSATGNRPGNSSRTAKNR